jgi:hypothetical protein
MAFSASPTPGRGAQFRLGAVLPARNASAAADAGVAIALGREVAGFEDEDDDSLPDEASRPSAAKLHRWRSREGEAPCERNDLITYVTWRPSHKKRRDHYGIYQSID